MTRPLRYDDAFLSILKEKLHDKFLNLFYIKVQSTAFFQKLSLLNALVLVGFIDVFIGFVYGIIFFKAIHQDPGNIILLHQLLMMMSIVFGILGVNSSSTMSKKTVHIFKNWRIFITFVNPILEVFNGFYNFCFMFTGCYYFIALIFLVIFLVINLYLTFVSWSFFIRLDKCHELLIIHGKYLDKMMENDNYKITLSNKYMPPDTILSNRGSNVKLSLNRGDSNIIVREESL
jgi:hypothetical protein